jgi:hypothetical protein
METLDEFKLRSVMGRFVVKLTHTQNAHILERLQYQGQGDDSPIPDSKHAR